MEGKILRDEVVISIDRTPPQVQNVKVQNQITKGDYFYRRQLGYRRLHNQYIEANVLAKPPLRLDRLRKTLQAENMSSPLSLDTGKLRFIYYLSQ